MKFGIQDKQKEKKPIFAKPSFKTFDLQKFLFRDEIWNIRQAESCPAQKINRPRCRAGTHA